MTPEAQRIAIAEARGWTWSPTDELWYRGSDLRPTSALPDYLNSLDAVHEAEKVLRGYDLHRYHMYLSQIAGPEVNAIISTPARAAAA